jgi:hypothetical protein
MTSPSSITVPEMVAYLGATRGFVGLLASLGLQAPPAPTLIDEAALMAFIDETPWARARLVGLWHWQRRVEAGGDRRRHGDDLRGLADGLVTATTGVTDAVQEMHHAFGAFPIITDLNYAAIRGVTRLVGRGLETALETLSPVLGDGVPGAPRDAIVSAINGVVGDHLAATGNPLAITATLRPPLPGDDDTMADDDAVLLVLVHGSSATDQQWHQGNHDHGVVLGLTLGFTPIYARYNSGRHVSENGDALAALLDGAAARFRDVVIVAHSMGGLVARAALHAGTTTQQAWRRKVRALVTLGTPHHGAPLEQGGNVVETLLGKTPWTAPLATLATLRSAGVTDLRHGTIREEDWRDTDRFAPGPDRRTPTPLPDDVRCFAVAATATPADTPTGTLRGDGLVPVRSALGDHDDARHRLTFTATAIVPETHHVGLLASPVVFALLMDWLRDLAPVPVAPPGWPTPTW